MKTEWIIGVKCTQKEGSILEETARTYAEYPYKVWKHPVSEAGSNSAICNITPETLAYDPELNPIKYFEGSAT